MTRAAQPQTSVLYQPVQADLARVAENLRGLARTGAPHLMDLLDHVLESPGKQMRPAITLLAARFHPNDGKLPVLMATAVELLHIATLIHDDTVDGAATRRGRATLAHVFGPNMAVLVGDYLFAASATFVCDTKNVRVIRRFAETIMELASGQLQEYLQAFHPQGRADYEARIYHKTASLFQTAAETGAILSGAPEESVQALRTYGYNLGMAFQIVDDILDFLGDAEEVGKPVGRDLQHGVMTLPAILLAERCPQDNPVAAYFETRDEAHLARALEQVQRGGILEECYNEVRALCRKATAALEGLPDVPARHSLHGLARYAVDRRQ